MIIILCEIVYLCHLSLVLVAVLLSPTGRKDVAVVDNPAGISPPYGRPVCSYFKPKASRIKLVARCFSFEG